ncbi:T9SS type A sorting domain-containing protein [Saprospiraceae bacterium]|nr:T9SS type A sorting domain-containing protein [Saprospiraceae bacterium]
MTLFLFTCSLGANNMLYAQSDYYLDSIADVTIDLGSSPVIRGAKYYYNSDNKVSKIVTESYIWNFIYDGNTTTELIEVLFNGPYIIKYESSYNDDGQLLVRKQFEDDFLYDIDSFFYENGNLYESKDYWVSNGNPASAELTRRKIFSYNSDNLIENTVSTRKDYAPGNSTLVITEDYDYNQNLLLLSWTETRLELDTEESSEESITYSYNSDLKLDTVTNFSDGFKGDYYAYAYRDSTVFQDNYIFDFNGNYPRLYRTETHACQHNYFSFDSLLTYRFLENGDSTLTSLETNQEDINSFVSDTLLHRNSVAFFDDFGQFSKQEVSKSYYIKTPEISSHVENSLPAFTISPNPVFSGSVLRIADLDFDFDQVAIYSLDGRTTQFLTIQQYHQHFNAPKEKGMYLIQLWSDKKAVTQLVKLIVQ